VLAGCGPERGAITAGGRIFGDNLTVYTSVPDPATGLGRDMVDASKLALAQAGGRAGDFGINFVAVDEGSPAHPDPPIIAARAAERTIRDTQVIAVVGALRSDAAMTSLPLFNAAGLLLVSPGAGYPGFTSAVAPGEPERWYPSGRRTFGRLIGDDREQARALVAAAGDGTVAIESEAGEAATALADAVRTEAGDRVVEDPARAGAVIYAGSDVDSAAAFARQTPRATLVFPDELTRAGLARRLAPAARRRAVFVSSAPRPGSTAELREFEAAFEEEFERPPDPYAVLAWQGTRRVLDAIEAAGTRARVRREVVERYLTLPPPPERFTAFRMRGGERRYDSGQAL
jgi:branched-chain amino acid transport system substrate-binding protein